MPNSNLYAMKEYRDLDPGNPNRVKFTYDSNGNMTSDYDRNIVTIRYNLLNLPEIIQFGNGNQIINSYDACGRKLSSNYFTLLYNLLTPIAIGEVRQWIYKPGSVDSKGSEYINNFEYTSTMVLVNQQWGSYYTSNYSLTRVKNSEGYVDGLLDYRSSPRYNYYHRDHLGNNCEVWTAPQPTYSGTQPAFVSQRTQYYPGGLPWAEGMGASQQPNKYNDKEFIEMHGYDTYDYMARGMYPASARFTTVDPLCEKYYAISPYAYCLDDPIKNFDPNGLYPKSILIYDPKIGLHGGYHFTQTAAVLLSLVSGVNQAYIQNAIIQERASGQYRPFYNANKGGGAITLGTSGLTSNITYTENYFADNSKAYNNHGYGQDITEWLSLSSHEVGHIPQIDKAGGLFGYLGQMVGQYLQGGHDDAPNEKEADEGYNTFMSFNKFVDGTYGTGALTNLFSSKAGENKKTATIGKWWNAYQESQNEQKKQATQSFIGNYQNLESGKYVWNGTQWVKQ